MDWLIPMLFGPDDGKPGGPPAGSPPTRKFEGPWFSTQLYLSSAIGVLSFLLFSYLRPRFPLMFAPRTLLKGFSPHDAHAHRAFFGWFIPTIRTSEFAILQIVGLDAAVLLNFLKMSFYLFSTMSALAVVILMPINFRNNVDNPSDDTDTDQFYPRLPSLAPTNPSNGTSPSLGRDWLDLLNDANSYLSLHLIFTYTFTLLALYSLHRTYARVIRARQLFSLELVHSVAARTALITRVPVHLRGERALAVYFENMGLSVESVNIARDVGGLKKLLDERTKALLELERAWTEYLGNPSTVREADPEDPDPSGLPAVDGESEWGTPIRGGGGGGGGNERQPLLAAQRANGNAPARYVIPHKARPTLRPGWFKGQVDALEYLEERFKEADERVRRKRRTGRFKASHVAFVTFEKMSFAQIAAQTVHAPRPLTALTSPAPEPRDIVWANVTLSPSTLIIRKIITYGLLGLLFFTWIFPIAGLASLLSYAEIKRTLPWLGRLIDANEDIRAIVTNLLPSVGMILLNACLPFALEALSYLEGQPSRSHVEYAIMRKYFLFLLVNVVFIFLLVSTYWQLIRDLAESPAKVPEKLARSLQQGKARHFFLSYVMLQALGIMPLQLLNLGVILPYWIYRLFITRTPRDFAELNAPPMINYGVVYPQAILIFVVTLLYSVIQPTILIFGSAYFGVSYVVWKYKLLFVFYKPYESQGQAWRITFTRCIWGTVIFQVFMTGIFILKKSFKLAGFMGPLMAGTVAWAWYEVKVFGRLGRYVNLSAVAEVQRGGEEEGVRWMREGYPVSLAESNLNRRRYAENDETLYVAPEDERTDYSQPPMANWYSGVLNTGKRRYGHPALTGVLPQPWLPLKKGQTLVNRAGYAANGKGDANGKGKGSGEAVVLTLRKRYSIAKRGRKSAGAGMAPGSGIGMGMSGEGEAMRDPFASPAENPWVEVRSRSPPLPGMPSGSTGAGGLGAGGSGSAGGPGAAIRHRLSFDGASGVIMLPDDGEWLMEDVESESDEEDYGSAAASRTTLNSASASSTSPSRIGGTPFPLRLPGHAGDVEAQSGSRTPTGAGAVGHVEGMEVHNQDRTASSASLASSTGTATPRHQQRHGTYFHHPERQHRRRTVTIPGAFPRT